MHRISKVLPFNYTSVWHVDEKFVRVKGSKDDFAYLFVVTDSKNHIIATYVANARTTESAKIVLRKIFGRKTRHVIVHFKRKLIVLEGNLAKYFYSMLSNKTSKKYLNLR